MTSQLACTYAALILHDDGMAISADNIKTLTAAAGCEIEAYWPALFSKALENASIDDLLTSVSSGGGSAGPAAAAGDGAAEGGAAATEEKKKSSSSSDAGGGGGMFDDDY
eukprot:TRINITY_DN4409_c0_g1_i2.p1 TRINITY_DN4409_c0_g1~~TRINITY_DN4409_c0_g1_i2.p1  ORF type:complete len:110 (+),score=39.89 TRINITY_DN4409_c0_g1_i2:220-549(+)